MKNFKLTNGSRSYLIQQIRELDLTEPLKFSLSSWSDKRGLSSNALSHVWYQQIADFICDDAKSVKAQCKIDFGIGMALKNKESFPALEYILDKTNFWQMAREKQCILISGIEMTRKFSKSEMSNYMSQMQVFWGSAGLNLSNEN